MLKLESNKNLQKLNTLAIPSIAERFVRLPTIEVAREAIEWANAHQQPVFVLGGGSNIIAKSNISGIVVQAEMKGLSVEEFQTDSQNTADEKSVLITAEAGLDWHEFVTWCMGNQYYGLENLALIPGKVGAAPIQNIGAYGVEVKSYIHHLEALDLVTGEKRMFNNAECQFSYRDSIFKQACKNKYLITSVSFKLRRDPVFCLEYPALKQRLDHLGDKVQPKHVYEAVIALRQSKLPDPTDIPNAGSFFKNPIVSNEQQAALQKQFPEIVSFPYSETHCKLAAAWLIDQAGWKQKTIETVCLHQQQALVLTNPYSQSSEAVLAFAAAVQQDIHRIYGVRLEREPQVFGVGGAVAG